VKLVTFEAGGRLSIGAVEGEQIAVLSGAPEFASMQALIESGEAGLTAARAALPGSRRVALNEVRLRAPLPVPIQMRDALCFEQHLRQARANRHLFGRAPARIDPADVEVPDLWYRRPVYYTANRFAVCGPDDKIPWPWDETCLDYELEMACVLGRSGRDISVADAPAHVFGYMIFNDFSARDTQMAEMAVGLGTSKAKDWDGANAMGPWLVTADEVDPAAGLSMRAWVNGDLWSEGQSDTMHHDFADVIAFVSHAQTLHAGEVLCSGTVGNGCGLELGRFLSPGDVVELEIEGLGRLRNTIGQPCAGLRMAMK
tara:strand:- start:84617 stop:85558 length:942 start_codon:yes stop_codon:yes gene_type:complete